MAEIQARYMRRLRCLVHPPADRKSRSGRTVMADSMSYPE
jgi:hypothetical protein